MFLPIGDLPNPRGTPYVNYALIGINVAVFLLVSLPLMAAKPDLNDPLLLEYLKALGARGSVTASDVYRYVTAYDLFVFRWGYRPAEPSVVTLISAMFLHGGWMHLIGNMLFLWIYGDNVEHRLGRVGYLAAYLGTGVAATLFFALFVPQSRVPLLGASGAISGVLGCYFLWFPRNQVKVFIFLFPFIMNTFLIPARFVLGFYLLVDNLVPFLVTRGGGSGVAHGAHIGGFIAGLALAWLIDRKPIMKRRARVRREERAEEEFVFKRPAPGDEAGQIAGFLREGNLPQAAAHYFRLEGRHQRLRLDAADVLAIGDFMLERQDYEGALAVFRRFIAERPADPRIDQAFLGAGKAMIHIPRQIPAAYQYFLSAIDAAKTPEVTEEARMHLRAIERLGEND